ncbi:uncharacterized protein LOC130670463 [Microplitis mediator]|uniref:uncharacterized protein LOC130670463 n=1 Tax=Microplitis mediator TaxID=375433 RepID=UPI002554A599|nr:uncharacterized protein LOC130670463 [Microplitis mediator]
MTERLASLLNLPKRKYAVPIGVLDSLNTTSKHMITATIRSSDGHFERTLQFLTVPQIAGLVPNQTIDRGSMKIPRNLKLADPHFHRPAAINMLLGSGISLSILCVGQINLSTSTENLYLQKTRLGWVVGGQAPASNLKQIEHCHVSNEINLEKFWEIEQDTADQTQTSEEIECEKHYRSHVTRDSNGRYVVALPFNDKIKLLGESRSRAIKRFINLENKLLKNSELREAYHATIQEYIDLGHMTELVKIPSDEGYYLPHHAVVEESSTTTKLRVVFDGSAKTSTGWSLNDALPIGPTRHTDLTSLWIRFRIYEVVFTADTEKMFRQIIIRPEDRKYQRIIWRNKEGKLTTMVINVLIFGGRTSPFIASRTFAQLAEDEGHRYPLAATIITKETYVDDTATGADTLEEAREKRNQLIALLKLGCFNIRQWASNVPELLEDLPKESINSKFQLGESVTLKTLGIYWNANEDTIVYTVKLPEPTKLDWNESLPLDLHTEWRQFQTQLQELNHYTFPRHAPISGTQVTEIHGFCDASEKAYGACLYLRTIDSTGDIKTELLCAKSRVAPTKSTTIPRLELCGASVLSNLYASVVRDLPVPIDKTIFWTDSTIVLYWLKSSEPQQLKQFVSNRVLNILKNTRKDDWYHVRTKDNPADILSRGLLPTEFIRSALWRHGPTWLQQTSDTWPTLDLPKINTPIPELKRVLCFHATPRDTELWNKFSSMTRLESIVALCMRMKIDNKNKGIIRLEEIHNARKIIFKLAQSIAFAEEIHRIQRKMPLSSHSKLLTLNPFIDKEGLLRVGGRLQNSSLDYSEKHQIILPKSHHITSLIIRREHLELLHMGAQGTLYNLRRRYWIIDGRKQVRKVIRQCVTCARFNAPKLDYLMGDLPADRVNFARPFSKVGVDYCGPFLMKEKKFRNRTQIKIYVAIFVCLAVKAVHIEVVTDLTTEAFLAALQRFIGRRGKCSNIYSDNGTNFVGANNSLKELNDLWNDPQHNQRVHDFATHKGIRWHFIPTRAPSFGGLWEAAVKSFKHHLKRAIGTTLFTYEEFNTIVINIEAILNSRPLTPLSSDPNDLQSLTPGHFLIGDTLTSLPEHDYREIPENRLSRWQHLQQIRQHFWNRCSKEYLNELNIRHKWSTKGQPETIKIGTVVLIKEDNLPPLQWRMGLITNVHPGADGVIRVVTVKTSTGNVERCIRKIAPLPVNIHEEDAVSTSEEPRSDTNNVVN